MNPCKCCSFFCVFFFIHIMKCKLPIKQIKIKEYWGGGGLEFGLTEIVLSFPRLVSMNYRLFFYFEAALLHFIGRFFEEIYSCILGRVVTIRLIIKKDKTLVCKKRIAIMFSFCWLVKTFIQYITKWRFRAQEFIQIYLYSIANITSAASSLKFRKYLQLGSVRQRQRHNPLAYMMQIYSILSLQCIVGRFSNTAVSLRRLCCRVLAIISRGKSKTGPD